MFLESNCSCWDAACQFLRSQSTVQIILSIHWSEQEVLLSLSHVSDNSSRVLLRFILSSKIISIVNFSSTTDFSVYRQYKIIIRELSKLMKTAAKHDLADRLDDERRPVSLNFTAKISLSDLTKSARMRTQILAESQNNFQLRSNTAMNENIAIEKAVTIEKETFESASSFRSIYVVNLTSYMKIESITLNRTEVATSTEWFLTNNSSISILTMIFYFIRTDDVNKQDIISMRDIFDSSTNCLSWAKLLEILKTDHDLRMTFKKSQEVLMINNQIRVSNERQFLACLQYLHNSNISNSKTLVYDVSELVFSKNELTLHQLWHFSKKLQVSQKRHWLLFE